MRSPVHSIISAMLRGWFVGGGWVVLRGMEEEGESRDTEALRMEGWGLCSIGWIWLFLVWFWN